jgi:cell division protein ZapA
MKYRVTGNTFFFTHYSSLITPYSFMTEQLIPATIVIADRSYRIKLQPKDEEVVRKTVKTINDKILEFKTQFAGKDMQDYVSMALVWYATEQNEASAIEVEKENLADKLNLIERMLDGQLPS